MIMDLRWKKTVQTFDSIQKALNIITSLEKKIGDTCGYPRF